MPTSIASTVPSLPARYSRRTALRSLGRLAATGGVIALATAAPAIALGACAAPSPSKAPVTLTVNGSDIQEMVTQRAPAFQQQYPNVTVNYEQPPDYNAKLPVLAAAGSLGDVVEGFTNQGQYQFLATNGVFVDLGPYAQKNKYDLKQFYDLGIASVRVDGKLYGLPIKGQIARYFLFYNADIFQNRGVAPPTANWSYDDLAAAAQKLQQTEGGQVKIWGYAGNWRELAAMIASLRPWGGDVMSADGKKATLDTAQAMASLTYHYNLSLKQQVAVYEPTDVNSLFYKGMAAMLGRVNAGTAGNILQNKVPFKWDMVRMPAGPAGKRGGMWLPDSSSVTKVSKHPDDAWNLNAFLNDKESGIALAFQTKESSTPGSRPDVYADPRILQRPGYPAGVGQEQQAAMAADEPYETAWNFLGGNLDSTLGPQLDKITKCQVTLDEGFLQSLNGQLQAIMDKPRSNLTK
jgi:multiple sugar transport system substrate-binding protein